jgi:hypothetical protein
MGTTADERRVSLTLLIEWAVLTANLAKVRRKRRVPPQGGHQHRHASSSVSRKSESAGSHSVNFTALAFRGVTMPFDMEWTNFKLQRHLLVHSQATSYTFEGLKLTMPMDININPKISLPITITVVYQLYR